MSGETRVKLLVQVSHEWIDDPWHMPHELAPVEGIAGPPPAFHGARRSARADPWTIHAAGNKVADTG
jgi:hypothetical protein